MTGTDLPIVRFALPEEEEEVMEMCRHLHVENGLFTLNENKVRDILRRYYKADKVIIGVIGETGRLQASTCLVASDNYYTDDWHLAELWNFVEPEYRRSRNAEALIEYGKSISSKMGIPFFTGITTAKQMAGKVRLYRRRLGYPKGASFIYNAKWNGTEDDFVPETHDNLRRRIVEFMERYGVQGISRHVVREKLTPLLREAVAVLRTVDRESDFWFPGERGNGADKHESDE